MPRPIQALIHREALSHNLGRMRAAAPDAKVWAVVKADAYGHGIERVYDALRAADGFALLDLAEAQRIRDLGWRGPILLLEGAFEPRDLETCSRLDLWHTVHCEEQIAWLASHKTQQPHGVFLKLNSGMNRLGFAPDAFRAAWHRLDAMPQVDTIGLMTHFSHADGEPGVDHQADVFDAATRDLPGERSLSNSAALLRHPQLRQRIPEDWVRPGIAVYGSAPDHPLNDIARWDLRPTMTLRSRLIAVQRLSRGDVVGYGGVFRAPHAMTIGVVACGYADGYPRVAPGGNDRGTPALVNGVRTRTVGRVSMDMLCVDLTPVPHAGMGSEVTLWGEGPNGARLPIDEVAHAAGTLAYELMCALAPRVAVDVVD
jgi:alanine racemase